MLSWENPLGYENFRVNLGTGYERGNSNIDFYDSDSCMAFITIGYQFGGGGDDDDDDD